jgi:hypothetical protein
MGQKEIHPLGDRKIRVDFNYEREFVMPVVCIKEWF